MQCSKEFGINLRGYAKRVLQAFEKNRSSHQNYNDMECECLKDEQKLAANKKMKEIFIYLLI
jgi:hypothetical protein